MNKPDMILFDYGDTLLYEPEFDALHGMRAIFPFIDKKSGVVFTGNFGCRVLGVVRGIHRCAEIRI